MNFSENAIRKNKISESILRKRILRCQKAKGTKKIMV